MFKLLVAVNITAKGAAANIPLFDTAPHSGRRPGLAGEDRVRNGRRGEALRGGYAARFVRECRRARPTRPEAPGSIQVPE